jgi:hypothetical protein
MNSFTETRITRYFYAACWVKDPDILFHKTANRPLLADSLRFDTVWAPSSAITLAVQSAKAFV